MGDSRAVALVASLLAGLASSCCKATPPPAGPSHPEQPDAGIAEPPDAGPRVEIPPPKPCTSVDGCRAACRAAEPQGCLRLALIATSFPEEEHLLVDEAAALRKACEGGDGRTCMLLGSLYCAEDADAECDAPRVARLRAACDQGEGVSCGYLAYAYPDDIDDAFAEKAMQKLGAECDGGDALSCRWLGYFLSTGTRTDEPRAEDAYRRAVPLLLAACEAGDPFGCMFAADLAGGGRGQEQNLQSEEALYAKACSLGLRPACPDAGGGSAPAP